MIQLRFEEIIEPLLGNKARAIHNGVALAISGGSDSIALLYLMSDWIKSTKVRLVVFSVDHDLRANSVNDVEFVRNEALKLGLEFYDLKWVHQGIKAAIQAKARQARYQLMTDKCKQLGITCLMTAHHADDLLENYLMRKKKKASLLGLSFSDNYFFNDVEIIRPFLKYHKVDLLDYLKVTNIKWIEDESNKNDCYERNRVRKEIEASGVREQRDLYLEMLQSNEQAKKVNNELVKSIAEVVEIYQQGFAIIDLGKFSQVIIDIQIYIINYITTIIGGNAGMPRYRSIGKLLEKIRISDKIASSVHGCIIKKVNQNLLIFREISDIKMVTKLSEDKVLWDNRFQIQVERKADLKQYSVEKLKFEDYVLIRKELEYQEKVINNTKDKSLYYLKTVVGNYHKSILFTLPVIKNLEKIVAIPHISYYDDRQFVGLCKITFRPNFISRFTHFL